MALKEPSISDEAVSDGDDEHETEDDDDEHCETGSSLGSEACCAAETEA